MDLTELKLLEGEPSLQRFYLQQLFNNSPDAIVMLVTRQNIHYVVEVNPAFERLFGYSNDEIKGKPLSESIIPLDNIEEAKAFLRASSNEEIAWTETQRKCKDGSLVDVSAVGCQIRSNGELIGLFVIYRDITERRRAEEALKSSAKLLKEAQTLGRIGSWEHDVEKGTIAWSDETYVLLERDMRLGPPDLGEETRPGLIPYYVMAFWDDTNKAIDTGQNFSYDRELTLPSGKKAYFHVIIQPVRSKGKIVKIHGTIQDITERKQAEEALRESEERFRRLVDHAPDIIFRRSVDGKLEYISPVVTEITGYSPEDLKNDPSLGRLLARQADEQAAEDYESVVREGRSERNRELACVRKDGKLAHLDMRAHAVKDDKGKIIAFEGILRDITDRKLAEEALRASEEKFRLMFESVTDGIIVSDNNLTIVEANEAAIRMAGYESKAEIIGRNALEFVPERDRALFPRNVQWLIEQRQAQDTEQTLLRKDARELPIELSAAVLRDGMGNPVGTVTIAKDISERKEMQQQLMLSDRLASVGELAAGVAHELNNPLTSVIGFSQLLREKAVGDDIKEDLRLINIEAQRAARTVKSLLTFARKHTPVKDFNQINGIVDDVLKLRAYEQKVNNIQVERRFALNLPEITVDRFQMQQVFLNIIINAEYFMVKAHNGGKLTITTEQLDEMVRISFADDGPGIPKEDLNRLFTPFFTTKPVGKGTGLGLSICYGIVAEHGGRICAKGEPGKGATFVVELPIKVAEEAGYGRRPTLTIEAS